MSFDSFIQENSVSGEPPPPVGDGAGFTEGLKRGVAKTIGGIGDTPARLYQLEKAYLGFLLSKPLSAVSGKPQSDFLPDVNVPATSVFTDYLMNNLANPEAQPKNATDKMLLGTGEAIGGSLYPSGLLKTPAEAGLKEAAKIALKDTAQNVTIGGIAGAGSQAGGLLSGGNPYAEAAGGLLAPAGYIALSPLMMAKRLAQEGMKRGKEINADKLPGVASGYVTNRISDAAAGNPQALQTLEESKRVAESLGEKWVPSIGESTNTPALLDLESKFSSTSPLTLNREAARRAGNEQAIKESFAKIAPSSTGSNLSQRVNDALLSGQGQINLDLNAVTNLAAPTSQASVGGKLLEAAKTEKRAMQQEVITPAYEKAFEAAGDSKTNIDSVIKTTEDVLGETLSKVKPEVAPNTIAAIKRMQAKAEPTSGILDASGKPMAAASIPETTATLRELDDLRKAINADVRSAVASMNPIASMQARNLLRVQDAITEAVKSGSLSQEAKTLYADAVSTWKTEFKPRFKEGVNYDLLRGSTKNEPSSIRLDEITGKYFRPGGEVEAQQFVALAGKNTDMKDQLRRGIIDQYRAEVFNPQTGALDVAKHNTFIHKYEKPLGVLADGGIGVKPELDKIGESLKTIFKNQDALNEVAKRIGYGSTDELVSSVISDRKAAFNVAATLGKSERQDLTRAIMDKVWNAGQTPNGLNAQGMAKFIEQNRNGVLDALTAAEGAAVATQHLKSLETLSKAADIATRGKTIGGIAGATDDPLKASVGISLSTVMSQARGVQMGRSSVPVAVSMMAGPIMHKLGMERFDELMYGSLHSKEIADNLAGLITARAEAQSQWFGKRLLNSWNANKEAIIGGMGAAARTATGAVNIKSNVLRSIPPTIGQIQQQR